MKSKVIPTLEDAISNGYQLIHSLEEKELQDRIRTACNEGRLPNIRLGSRKGPILIKPDEVKRYEQTFANAGRRKNRAATPPPAVDPAILKALNDRLEQIEARLSGIEAGIRTLVRRNERVHGPVKVASNGDHVSYLPSEHQQQA